MRAHNDPPHRRLSHGAVMLETAIVLPILLLFLIGTITIGMGIFCSEQVAAVAREGARYAKVHGGQYATETGNSAATSSTIKTAVEGLAVGLVPANLTLTANPSPVGAQGTTVSVTVSYSWTPLMYIAGPITLSSTSVMVVAY